MTSAPGLWLSLAATATSAFAAPAGAQDALDRVDAVVAADRSVAGPAPAHAGGPLASNGLARESALQAGSGIEVSAITVDGAPSIPPASFLPATEPFIGRPLAADDLRNLATNVANILRSRGYVFASAWVAPQALQHGVLRVTADEGRIDRVRLTGRERPAVSRALRALTDGQPVTNARLERALLIAGDLPGIDIRNSQYDQEEGRGVLTVDPALQRTEVFASLDNHGSGSAGPVRFRGRIAFNDVALGADQLSFRTTLTPLDPRELTTLGGEYSAVLDRAGTVASLSGSITRVRPGERYRRLDLDSRSMSANFGLMRPLHRSVESNLWASGDFAFRDSEQDRSGILARDDRVASLSFGLSGYTLVKRGWLSGRVTLRQGLDVLGATEAGDARASRRDGDGVFTKAEAFVEWTGPLLPRVGLRVAAEGQLASRPLLSSEEFGVGGPRFGRAYEYSERRGDQGVSAMAEIHYRVPGRIGPMDDVKLYTFVDGGTVDNLRSSRGGGLVSAGGGVRFDLGRVLDAELEVAAPIGRDRFETGDREPRLNFTINARF